MNFWEQFLIIQAQAALHAVLQKYAAKYFSTEEQMALNTVADALIDLPRRIHDQPPATH